MEVEMSKGKVLLVCSPATRIEVQGGGWGITGHYLNETVVPVMAALDAGYEVELATPDGNKPHMDAASDAPRHFEGDVAAYERARAFWNDSPVMNQARTLASVVENGLDDYVGLFIPGGQAPVVDLMQDADLGKILRHFHEKGKVTAMLCHGPVAVAAAMPHAREFRAALIAGDKAKAAEWAKEWQYDGYKLTVFSDTEEKVIEDQILHAKLYFNMIEALETAGAKVIKGSDFAPHLEEDRELITGQNPRSDHLVAASMVRALDRATAAAR
jgi:putative intracellular protease/amidase